MITTNATSTAQILPAGTKTGFAAMGSSDFIKLMTTQITQQDPTDPVDSKDMLAQMAQFSSLAGISEVNSTLKDIATKLDAVFAAQAAAKTEPAPTTTT
jgi:flagellar basal-body rod modification protein FlgD